LPKTALNATPHSTENTIRMKVIRIFNQGRARAIPNAAPSA
jgi:hypothetical protein